MARWKKHGGSASDVIATAPGKQYLVQSWADGATMMTKTGDGGWKEVRGRFGLRPKFWRSADEAKAAAEAMMVRSNPARKPKRNPNTLAKRALEAHRGVPLTAAQSDYLDERAIKVRQWGEQLRSILTRGGIPFTDAYTAGSTIYITGMPSSYRAIMRSVMKRMGVEAGLKVGKDGTISFGVPKANPRKRNPVARASRAGDANESSRGRYAITDTMARMYARHLAPLTDENQHAEARMYLARTVLASPTFTEKVKDGNARMDRSHTTAHYHDNEAAWKANHALLKRMLAQVKRRTTPAGYAAIHGAL